MCFALAHSQDFPHTNWHNLSSVKIYFKKTCHCQIVVHFFSILQTFVVVDIQFRFISCKGQQSAIFLLHKKSAICHSSNTQLEPTETIFRSRFFNLCYQTETNNMSATFSETLFIAKHVYSHTATFIVPVEKSVSTFVLVFFRTSYDLMQFFVTVLIYE